MAAPVGSPAGSNGITHQSHGLERGGDRRRLRWPAAGRASLSRPQRRGVAGLGAHASLDRQQDPGARVLLHAGHLAASICAPPGTGGMGRHLDGAVVGGIASDPGICSPLPAGASSVLCKRQFLFLAPQAIGAVEKWESWFCISTFPPPKSFPCVWRLFLISIGFLPRCVGPFGASRATPPSARESRLMRYFIFSFRFYLSGYANASGGTRSPSRIAKRCKAAFQSCTGIVHFLAICSSARNSNFSAASAVGNDPLVLITLRSDMFSDSMAFVV